MYVHRILLFTSSFHRLGGYLFLCPLNRCIDHREGRVHLKPFARQVWWLMGESHRTGDKQHMDIYSWPPLTKKIELSSNQHTGGRRSGKWDVRRLWLHLHDRVVFVSSINWVYNDEPLSAQLPNVITLNKTISQAFICIKKREHTHFIKHSSALKKRKKKIEMYAKWFMWHQTIQMWQIISK